MRCGTLVPLGLIVLAGCWKIDRTELPEGKVAFEPVAGGPSGWVVERFEFDATVTCPDDEPGAFYMIYPEGAAQTLPVAVILHSGAFDYVLNPPATDPLAGDHFQDETRLEREWAVRRVFETLGMYDSDDRFEDHLGTLPAELATQGVAMIVPANCWGDWWHNFQGTAENDFANDRFYRNGRYAADFSLRLALEPGWAPAHRMELPVVLDPTEVYLVGLGEGGRGAAELLHAGLQPTAVVIDSSADDLRPYYDDALYEGTVAGLNRIFPQGRDSTLETSLSTVPGALPPTAYLYSSLDAQIPAGAHAAAIAKVNASAGGWVYDAAVSKHVLTNSDPVMAQQAVLFLLGDGSSDTDAP